MNKKLYLLFTIIFLIISQTISLSSQETQNMDFYNDLLDLEDNLVLTTPQIGDYIIYESNFANKSLIVTILHLGNQQYYFKTFNKSNYAVNEFSLRIINKNGRYEVGGMSIKSGDLSSTDLQLAQLDFLKMLNARKKISVNDFPEQIVAREKWEDLNTTFEYTYKYWVPIANLFYRIDINNRENSFKILRFGKMAQEEQNQIFSFTGLDTAYDNSPTVKVENAQKVTATFDGIKIPLDENWTINNEAKTSLFNIDGERFSYINIQSLPNDKLPSNPYQFLNWQIMNSKAFIVPESVEILDTDGIPTLKFVVYDEKTLKKTISIVMLFERGDFTSILSFGSYLNFYNENKAYFDNILF